MQIQANSINEYLENIPEDRKPFFQRLRETILKNLPKGFEETLNYGMIGYVVPLGVYPQGYHAKAQTPLPFVNIASQKHHIALYHMGLYSSPELTEWLTTTYPKHMGSKLDMGKSCIRFKKPDQIPFDLIGQLMQKLSVQGWIEMYERR